MTLKKSLFALLALTGITCFVIQVGATDEKSQYLRDYDYIKNTVKWQSGSVKAKNIQWQNQCETLKPLFEQCKSDEEHVKNIMRLLALVQDGHTGVTESTVSWDDLPSKWNVVGGGGLGAGWDNGLYFLQGMTPNHELQGKVPLGSLVAKIRNRPAWIDLETLKQYGYKWQGYSTEHSFFATIGNCPFFFNDDDRLEITFLSPELKAITATLERYPKDGNFNSFEASTPDGVRYQEGAVSKMLTVPWAPDQLGYLRITGCMDSGTLKIYDAEFDKLNKASAIVLDCRSMGGGGDDAAWAMAGRFFKTPVANGTNGTIKPTGSWQFGGPVVMLQDEKEVSSAETFTWAMSETKRVVSVGRPTGGWCIIPQRFKCPSGIASFRMGVYNRETPITNTFCEGIGWKPDIEIPYGPVICAHPDFVYQIGLNAVQLLKTGVSRADVINLFSLLFMGKTDSFLAATKLLTGRIQGWSPETLAELIKKDMKTRLEMETLLLTGNGFSPPDLASAEKRFVNLEAKARLMGFNEEIGRLEKTIKALKNDPVIQEQSQKARKEIATHVASMDE